MQHSKYLIVGGGMTADAAITGIREVDPSGSVTVISAGTAPPYRLAAHHRPPRVSCFASDTHQTRRTDHVR